MQINLGRSTHSTAKVLMTADNNYHSLVIEIAFLFPVTAFRYHAAWSALCNRAPNNDVFNPSNDFRSLKRSIHAPCF